MTTVIVKILYITRKVIDIPKESQTDHLKKKKKKEKSFIPQS